jgi:predicted permease
VLKNVRYALRSLARSPLFAAAAILSLALGIGANTAIFSLFDLVMLRSLPVRAPGELVLLRTEYQAPGWMSADNMFGSLSYPMYRDLRDRSTVFSGVIARAGTGVNFSEGGETERIGAEIVSGNFFPVLGVRAALGRLLTPDDDRTPGAHPIAVLSYDCWVNRFGANRGVLGRKILLNGHPFTIVGVAAAQFHGVLAGWSPDVFVPAMMAKQVSTMPIDFNDRRGRWLSIIARIAPGVSREQAVAGTTALYRSILQEEIKDLPGMSDEGARRKFLNHTLELLPAHQGMNYLRTLWREPLIAILAMVGIVLLIGCANVANLMLARAAGRQREIAVRMAVGAGRWAIIRQLMTECFVLAAAAGCAGLLIAVWMTDLLVRMLPEDGLRGWLSASIDARMLAFNIGISALAAMLFGLAPAVQAAYSEVAASLGNRGVGAGMRHGQSRTRRLLVVAQVALSLVLLAGAGLFTRTLVNLNAVDPGFRAERLLKFSVVPMMSGYTEERSQTFFRDLRARLAAIPGVESVGAANPGPFTNSESAGSVTVEGYHARPGEDSGASLHAISAGYFKTIGARIVAGRELTDADEQSGQKLVLINEAFAKKYFSGTNPLGRRVAIGGGTPDREVVGVVGDMKRNGLREDAREVLYYPYAQRERGTPMLTYYVRLAGDEGAVTAAIRRVVRDMDPTVPVLELGSVAASIEESMFTARVTAFLAAAFGVLALVLAALGLYGIVAYNVERRRPELGVRMALGDTPSGIIRLVMGDVARMVAFGIAIGLPVALAGARLIESQLFGLTPRDPLALSAAIAVLVAVAAVSGLLPARRAAKVDPIVALRYE